MSTEFVRSLLGAAAGGAMVLAVGGCSVSGDISIGDPPGGLTKTELESKLKDKITLDESDAEPGVECEAGLADEVDARTDCTVTDDAGQQSGIRPTVTDTGSDFEYDVVVFIAASELASTLQQQIGAEAQGEVTVDCTEELIGEVGESVTCAGTIGPDSGNIEVEVTEVDGLRINFKFDLV